MNLVIHDLDPEKWKEYGRDYSGWHAVTDNGAMNPCIGCFSCWNHTPGKCAINDGYDNMGSLIHQADEVAVISRYTYGGFSGSVKNVFDRCLGYVLPQFEVIGNETHHKKRYDEDKPFTFIFYGHALSDDEKASALRYVLAVCDNIRGHVKHIEFRECEADLDSSEKPVLDKNTKNKPMHVSGKTVILNGSMRNISGNSAKLARKLACKLKSKTEIIDLKNYIRDMQLLAVDLIGVNRIILCVPLYVDGLPSQVIRFMELLESYQGEKRQIYVLANMGLYESSQLVNLFSAVRQWCGKCGYEYCGGLGISAGELLGTLMDVIPFRCGATKSAAKGMDALADAVNRNISIEDIYTEPYKFPRSLYIWIANNNWKITAKQNGLSPEDLYKRL